MEKKDCLLCYWCIDDDFCKCGCPKHRHPGYPFKYYACDEICGDDDCCDEWQACIQYKLNWEDIREIVTIADDLCNEWGTERMHNDGQEAYYTEVLKRFKNK